MAAPPDHGQVSAAEPVRVGLVGLGYWGPNLLRVLADGDTGEIAYLCDRDSERLARFGRRAPQATTTTDFEDLIGDDELDAVLIATGVASHYELALASLEAGKHTFVEKPLAASGGQADELIRLAERRGLTLMCGHTFLYSPPVLAVKELLATGQLGSLCFISSSRVNLGIHQRDLSILWDLGPHDFSIVLHWMQQTPVSVRAIGRASIVPDVHDVAFVDLLFADDVLVHVELSWLAPSKLRRTVIVGRERMVIYEDGVAEPLRIFDHGVVYQDPETFGEYQLSYRTGDIVSPKLESVEPLAVELEHFLDAVRRREGLPENLAIARNVIALIEASERSAANGGETVPFSPPVPV